MYRRTCDKIKSKDALALAIPARDLDIHLIHLVLVGERGIVDGRSVSLCIHRTPYNHSPPLLAHLTPALHQSLLSLLLHDARLGERNGISEGRRERRHHQDGRLEEKHDHHVGASLLDDDTRGVAHEPGIIEQRQEQRDGQARMKESRIRRRLLLEYLDAPVPNPAPDLARQQRDKHGQEPSADFLAKDGHGQARLRHGKPGLFVQLFDLDGSQGPVAQSLHAIDAGDVDEEDDIDENLPERVSASLFSVCRL